MYKIKSNWRIAGWVVCLMMGCLVGSSQWVHAQGDSGFLRGQGNLDMALTYGIDTYDEFWIGSNRVTDAPFGRVSRHTVNLYGAYGLGDDMDLALSGSFVYVTTEEVFDSEKALQDFTAQFKWRFFSKDVGSGKLNLLAAPAVKVPMTHYEDDAVPAVGDGQVDLRLRLLIQYVFGNGAYLALDTGYDFRFDVTPDEFPIHVTGGFTLFERLTLSGFFSHIDSLDGYDIGQGPFPGIEDEYDRIGGHVYCRLTESLGLTVSAWTTLDGMNTGDVDGASLGMVLRF